MNSNADRIKEKKNTSLILCWNLAFWNQAIKYFFILVGAEKQLSIVIWGILLTSIALFIYGTIHNKRIIINRDAAIIVPVFVSIILYVTYMCNKNNTYVVNYMSSFFQFTFVPLLAITAMKGDYYRKFIEVYCDFAIVLFILLGFTPLWYPTLFTNSMAYGFAVALPSGIAFYIGRHYLNRKWIIPFELACYVMGIISATRSTILSYIIMIVICNLVLHNTDVKRAILYFIAVIFAFFVYSNLSNIINYLIEFLGTHFNYKSRSLAFLYMGITGDTTFTGGYSNFSSGRDFIQIYAFKELKENLFTGIGIGSFEYKYDFYSHNIALDFALNWGLIGAFAFIIIIFISIKTILKIEKGDYSPQTGMLLLILCLWFPKLFFSMNFINDLGFWSFIIFAIKLNQSRKSIKSNI